MTDSLSQAAINDLYGGEFSGLITAISAIIVTMSTSEELQRIIRILQSISDNTAEYENDNYRDMGIHQAINGMLTQLKSIQR